MQPTSETLTAHYEALTKESAAITFLVAAPYMSVPPTEHEVREHIRALIAGYQRVVDLLPAELRPVRREVHTPPRIPGDHPRA